MTDELLDMTVNEQKNELENLSTEELKDLREGEERQTAIDNIGQELSSRQPQEDEIEDESQDDIVESDQEPLEKSVEADVPQHIIDGQRELRRKVDYLIEKCKTTSQEGFKNYEN